MSVNKFMHPRNIYKTPPNFKQMAIDYPEFRKYVKQDLTGKIKVDFKSNETLRALTQTLLKKDFGLDVIIPLDRLIPTVPLRLNYILWLEDLLDTLAEESHNEHQDIYGIDIGTGASCVYPLLAAKINKWHMTASEIDDESFNTAQQNVLRNNLLELVDVKKADKETLLKNIVESGKVYHFCMCNPPFFSSTNELDPKFKARSENRTLPRNALTGTTGEVVVSGGEVEFVSRLIKESFDLKHQIRIFTTMVGHKSSLAALKMVLRSIEVVSFKQTEFHQGHTTRWGLAWTFQNIDLRKVPQATIAAARKKPKPPLKHVLPYVADVCTMDSVVTNVRNLLQTLQMEYEEIKRNQNLYACQVTARENTWSNQRRKRREQLRKQRGENNHNGVDLNSSSSSTNANNSTEDVQMDVDTSTDSVTNGGKRSRGEESGDEEYYNLKKLKTNGSHEVYLKITIILRKLANDYHLEMSRVDGIADRDAVHQVMQYFKNNLK